MYAFYLFFFCHMESLMKNIHPWLVKKAGMFFMSISYVYVFSLIDNKRFNYKWLRE
jgi:hypothetical protein